MAYVPLFCRSHYSPHGVAHPAELVRRARSLGYTTLGICDEGTIAGFHEFDAACRAQGIRPVFGCRLCMQGLGLTGQVFPIDFPIETEQGYRNLVRLLTLHHARGDGEDRPLTAEDLRGRTQGLIAVIPPDGELQALVRSRDRGRTERFLQQAIELFGPALVFGIESPTQGEAQQGRKMLDLARFIRATAAAAMRIAYPEPGDAAAAVFLNSPHVAPGRAYQPPEDLKSLPALWPEADVLARWTGEWEDLAHVAGDLARRCTWRPARIRRAFPTLDLERGFDPNSYLFDLVIRGATRQYGEITETLKQRINREFEELRTQNLAPYLLLCQQIAKALDDRGISRGVGRGRLVASVLAYSLGISRIDPLQYNLVAKSLLADGETAPPIQVEIPRGGVEPLLDWLRENFGDDHIAEIGRVQEVRRDQAINELAAWAGMTDEERRLAHRQKVRLRAAGAAQRLSELAEGKRSRRWRDPAFIGDIAARMAPRPRVWIGTADQFVVSGEPLECVVPLVRSAQGRPVSALEDGAIDKLGLARLAFVPHGLLDILDQAMHAARAQHPRLDFTNVPLDDRAAYDLLSRGDTAGIPPLEGITMRGLLRKNMPRNLLQLLRTKTEAASGREGPPRDLASELPDVLLSYQCAYLKANHPLAFYGAAISAVVAGRGNPAPLVRAARRAGHELKAPDINLSDWDTTIQAGAIRLGLAAVKGFGVRAWDHIKNVRSGGAFESLAEFCERVDTRIINLRTLRMLIAAGALDRLGRNRASMDAVIAQLQKTAREQEEREGKGAQPTLFDLDEWEEGEPPTEESLTPDVEDWNPWDRLQREHEALGFYLSMDPVRRFKIALTHLRPMHLEELHSRMVGRQVRLAGLVVSVERDGPLLAGGEDAIVDIEGLPVFLSRHMAERHGQTLEPATEILAVGRLEREKGFLSLRADGIWSLADLEDQATRVSRIRLSLAGENRATLKLLLELVHQFLGTTTLELADYPLHRGWTYGRLARQKVFFCSPLFQGLCKILPPESVQLFGADGQPYALFTASKSSHEEDPAEAPESTEDLDQADLLAGAEDTSLPAEPNAPGIPISLPDNIFDAEQPAETDTRSA